MRTIEPSPWPSGSGEMARLIGRHDWAATPLGPIRQWPQELKCVVDVMLAAGFPMIALWGDQLTQLYNDHYRDLMGDKHPAGLGQPTRECWPEVWHINAPIYSRVMSGETVTLQDALFPISRRSGREDAWFTLSYAPLRCSGHDVEGVLVTVFETTEAIRVRNALREREQHFRAFVVATSDVVYRMSPDWTEMRELDGQGFLSDMQEPTVDWMDHYILPQDRGEIQRAIARAILKKGLFELEHRVVRADGKPGWTLSRAVPILDERGEISEWLGAARDVTDRRENQEQFRVLFNSIDEGFCVIELLFDAEDNPVDYRFLQVNQAFERQTGLTDPVGNTMRELAPGHEQRWFDIYGRIALTGEPARFEDAASALGRWHDVYAFRTGEPHERRVAVLFRDVSERHAAEERQRLLLFELQHRVRNILAMIRSVARRSADTADTVEDYQRHLEGRITAMARTQVLLTRAVGDGLDLHNLILDELDAQAAQHNRFSVSGPDVLLPPKAAEVLGLTIHELATNSIKYGVLAGDRGRLDIRWDILQRDDSSRLRIVWSEQGVTVDQPRREGFGTILVTQRVPYELHGSGTIQFNGEGLVATIEFPLVDGPSILQTNADLAGGER